MQERALLHGLLEYVVQQAEQPDIGKLVIPTNAINPYELEGLPGVALDPTKGEDDVWLEIERLSPTKPPQIEPHVHAEYLRVSDDPNRHPTIDEAGLRQRIELESEDNSSADNDDKVQSALAVARDLLSRYMPSWSRWSELEVKRRHSIDLYDTLFSWNVGLSASTGSAQELVAGIAITGWRLPDTHHGYVYPLVTAPIEISITVNGRIQLCPRDARPTLEFDAFLAQQSITQAGHVRDAAKDLLLDGRKVTPFDESTFSDVVTVVANNLSSQCEIDKEGKIVSAGDVITYSYAWRILLRPRSSTVLRDDVARLQAEIESAVEIPDQPLSLVSRPSEEARKDEPIAFRGRGGVEGSGTKVYELHFPLPYNREQITIIDQLSKSPGVVVQGPPGTGKTHTIANIICHYLAEGKRVLVTAEKAHALKTVQEKIPEKVRPLVISRIGTEQEGRAQLQSSIDAILQELSQLKPSVVSENLQHAKALINRAHEEMVRVDRRIGEIASAHLSEINVDGVLQRADRMADLVINGRALHCWFDDELSLDERHAPPIDQDEFNQLKSERRAVAENLCYLEERIPSSSSLPAVAEIADLHIVLGRIRSIDDAEARGEVWKLRSGLAESLNQIRALLAGAEELRKAVSVIEEQASEKPWMQLLRNNLKSAKYDTERKALEKIIPDIHGLAEERGQFMERPVYLPDGFLEAKGALDALSRGAATGKPLGWAAALINGEVKDAISRITVSGLAAQGQADWAWVLRYVQLRDRCVSVFARWNQFAPSFGLPLLEINSRDLAAILKSVEELCRDVRHVHNVALQMDDKLDPAASLVFVDFPGNGSLQSGERISAFIQQLQGQLAKAELSHAKVKLVSIQEVMAGTSGKVSASLRELVQGLGGEIPVQEISAKYAELTQELVKIEGLSSSFQVIRVLSKKIEDAGAIRFARRIRCIPSSESGDDPVLHQTWREAWNWSRVKEYLDAISGREELVRLGNERVEIERALAKLYEDVSTQQAWLSLKTKASDKVTTALNRYKTAIQKIGKGTGKGAERYRKDAQAAMQDAAEAIPCWVMTHYQVMETMPAKLGLFDLIIVDEASQSSIEAIPVLMRGQKLLVVGDDKQVSPSNVGLSVDTITLLRNKYLTGQPHASVLTPEMSLYDMANAIYASNVMLLEHFRCHPSIIAYSNKNFYGDKIRPLRISKASERIDPPLVSIHTPEGVRLQGKGRAVNPVEAEAIVAELAALLADRRFSGRTIGVVSLLGPAQAEYIQKLAFDSLDIGELQKRQFACGEPSSFQGAERDIIFLSMVATPEDCHPLSRRDHEQRLNVAASRARERMYLVHSVSLDSLSPVDLRRNLLSHFSNPELIDESNLERLLEYCESGFEKDVLTELFSRGYRVTPQLKAGGFRIDMVVEGAGDARLAVECDGDSFHGPEQWPADVARQRALERAGWKFWRCFASTWKISRQDCIDDLLATLTGLGIEPISGDRKASPLVEARVWVRSRESEEAILEFLDEESPADLVRADAGSPQSLSAASTPAKDHSIAAASEDVVQTVNDHIASDAALRNMEAAALLESEIRRLQEADRLANIRGRDIPGDLFGLQGSSLDEAGSGVEILRRVSAELGGKGFRHEDNRQRNGALWVIPDIDDNEVERRLSRLGFAKARRGYWIK